jgi:hypothetical protein
MTNKPNVSFPFAEDVGDRKDFVNCPEGDVAKSEPCLGRYDKSGDVLQSLRW